MWWIDILEGQQVVAGSGASLAGSRSNLTSEAIPLPVRHRITE